LAGSHVFVRGAEEIEMETLEERIRRVTQEPIRLVPYDLCWPEKYEAEKNFLLTVLPRGIVRRIEHFGSTAIPGMPAKPIIDILLGVASLEDAKERIVPILTEKRYEYFWRPIDKENVPPYYAWFIKRNASGERICHVHIVDLESALWERILFRDYLIRHPETAEEYRSLKAHLAKQYPIDRVAYTEQKHLFVAATTQAAIELFAAASPVIRKALDSDVAAITDIYNEAILTTTATFDTEPKSLADRHRWFKMHDERHPIFVATMRGAVVGWASLSHWSDRTAYDNTAEASLYVKGGYHGQGLGRALYDALITDAQANRLHTIIARLAGDNRASAALHAAFGFVFVGTLKEVGTKFGRLLDVNLWQKILENETP
jgi:L-amino acid N-acyltransferase YncA/GrpB-like predicted nucleotidyltransferase (UPF0157 family)